ncbi:MAG TPA: hypothetical protein PKE30_09295 [Niabella sp.]|nr:hypothetical protein [Niabella sp.]
MNLIKTYLLPLAILLLSYGIAPAQQDSALQKKYEALQKKFEALQRRTDLVFSKYGVDFKFNDSLLKQYGGRYMFSDSMVKKMGYSFQSADSLFKKYSHEYKFSDTMFKKIEWEYKKYIYSLDSLTRLRFAHDTAYLNRKEQQLNRDAQQLMEDSLINAGAYKAKDVFIEIGCNKKATLFITNMGRKLIIKTHLQNNIRLETTVYTDNNFRSNGSSWAKMLNITVSNKDNEIAIQPAPQLFSRSHPGMLNKKTTLTIYLPATVKLNIRNRIDELVILNNLQDVHLELSNTDVQMRDADKAFIKSAYGSVKAGNIRIGELDLTSCKFTSGNSDSLLINSKYSTLSFGRTGFIKTISISDNYEIAQAQSITANKSFGSLNIQKLNHSIHLTGASAGLIIGAFDAGMNEVRVQNKYADLQLPLKNLKNYSIRLDGGYSELFAPDALWNAAGTKDSVAAIASPGRSGQAEPVKTKPSFQRDIGDLKNNFTKLIISCSKCRVDLR